MDDRGWPGPLHERLLVGVAAGDTVFDAGGGAEVLLVAAGRGCVAGRADGTSGLVVLVDVVEHVANPVAVLRDAAHRCEPGGRVRVTVRGRPSERDTDAVDEALAPLVSSTRRRAPARRSTGRASSLLPSRTGAEPVTDPGRLRRVAEAAGLRVTGVDEVLRTVAFPDADALVAAVLESATGRRAVMRTSGPRVVRSALLSGLSRFRDGDGYRMRDTYRILDATPDP